jgi:osmoprotectant transport system permease protein
MAEVWRYLTTAAHWTGPDGIIALAWAHLVLSVVSVALAAAVALPAARAVAGRPRWAAPVAVVVNTGRAIPSFALLALLLPLSLRWGFGLGFWPTTITMVVLALPPIFITTLTGLTSIPAATRNAARGLGLSERQIFTQVAWPLALPQVITGLRIALLQVIATATLGALVAFRGLGTLIEVGRASQNEGQYLSGALVVVVLALAAQGCGVILERRLASWRRG